MDRIHQTFAVSFMAAALTCSLSTQAQEKSENQRAGEALSACVEKAIQDNPGPDFSNRYKAVQDCQEKSEYRYIHTGEPVKISEETIAYHAERNRKIKLLMDQAEGIIKSQLRDPGSANIEWNGKFTEVSFKPDLLSKKVIGFGGCGFVNAKNAFGGYAGAKRFIVIFKDIEGTLLFNRIYTGNSFDFTEISCARTFFPPLDAAPPSETTPVATHGDLPAQLEALVRLRDSGALTPAEYDRAKAKLLNSD